MIQCDKCQDYVDQEEVVPISRDDGVWCKQCCEEGKLGSKDLAAEILAGRQTALDGVALQRMAVTLLESLKISEKRFNKLQKIRSFFDPGNELEE